MERNDTEATGNEAIIAASFLTFLGLIPFFTVSIVFRLALFLIPGKIVALRKVRLLFAPLYAVKLDDIIEAIVGSMGAIVNANPSAFTVSSICGIVLLRTSWALELHDLLVRSGQLQFQILGIAGIYKYSASYLDQLISNQSSYLSLLQKTRLEWDEISLSLTTWRNNLIVGSTPTGSSLIPPIQAYQPQEL